MKKTDTALYKLIYTAIEISGLSRRKFACKYNISSPWLIHFLEENSEPCKIRNTTAYKLNAKMGVPPELIQKYNSCVDEMYEEWTKENGTKAV